jgi:hypothetical protein
MRNGLIVSLLLLLLSACAAQSSYETHEWRRVERASYDSFTSKCEVYFTDGTYIKVNGGCDPFVAGQFIEVAQ